MHRCGRVVAELQKTSKEKRRAPPERQAAEPDEPAKGSSGSPADHERGVEAGAGERLRQHKAYAPLRLYPPRRQPLAAAYRGPAQALQHVGPSARPTPPCVGRGAVPSAAVGDDKGGRKDVQRGR